VTADQNSTSPSNELLIVVGIKREARIVGDRARVLVGGRGLDPALWEGTAAVMSFGLCGALDPAFKVGDLVIGTGVIGGGARDYETDAAWRAKIAAALPDAKLAAFAASHAIVGSIEAKAALHAKTGAGAVDMESYLAARGAADFGVPFAILRAVSDSAATSLSPTVQAGFRDDGSVDIGAILRALIARPWQIGSLISAGQDANRAFRTLTAAADAALGVRP